MKKLRITNEYIKSLSPCTNRFNNYIQHYENTDFSIAEFLKLDNITYSDKLWVWKKFATINEAAMFGLYCADSVLHIFQNRYPNDDRPRLALEAVREYLADPSLENKEKCKATAAAAYAAYAAATAAAATAAAYAASNAANAADAASNAAYAAYAANAGAAAANAAVDAAAYAAYAARDSQQDLNLLYLISIYEESK